MRMRTYNGTIDAVDAQRMYPQGHGDAYGHYLSALKGYYKLILNKDFSWVPQSETVTILGVPVAVDYMDERKFAAAAVALARSGNQITDLTWRKDYSVEKHISWENFSNVRKMRKLISSVTGEPITGRIEQLWVLI